MLIKIKMLSRINTLQIPALSKLKQNRVYSQLRPYRDGGFRIEVKKIKDKTFLYNYGHGGAGISLSYGSAIAGADLLVQNITPNQTIAIIGSGVIGLTQALQLKKRYPQHIITIYSSKIPTQQWPQNKELITSSIAPGYWLPYQYGRKLDSLHFQLAQSSYNQFKNLIKQDTYKECVRFCNVFDMNSKQSAFYLSSLLLPEQKQTYQVKNISLKMQNSAKQIVLQSKCFQSISINMPLFLTKLIQQCQNKNIKIIKRNFKNFEQFELLQQEVIVLCTGIGSKKLMQDPLMKGIRGHIIEYQNPNPKMFNYIFKFFTEKGVIALYCQKNRILLGLSRQETQQIQIDKNIVINLKERWAILQKIFMTNPMPKF